MEWLEAHVNQLWFCLNPTWALFALQSPKKVGDDIAKATGDWKGLRITVKLTIQNRQAAVCIQPPHIVFSSDLNRAASDCDAVISDWGGSLCIGSDHQSSEGASSWQEEGQEQ